MSKYLDITSVKDLVNIKNIIFAERNRAFSQHGIDILSNDIMSNLCIYEIVSQYDSDVEINFSRNGEDGKSRDHIFEAKTSRINALKHSASFMFHAMGDLAHERYIFAIRRKDNLEIVRLYDISDPDHVAYIFLELWILRDQWYDKGLKDPKSMKRDVIVITEDLLRNNFNLECKNILGCEVYTDKAFN